MHPEHRQLQKLAAEVEFCGLCVDADRERAQPERALTENTNRAVLKYRENLGQSREGGKQL